MKPTVHDIAARAGVSLATVDRVLNGRPGVRAPTREKVEAAVAELGFVRDVAAANLAKSRVYTFAFIIPANDNSFMMGLRAELEAVRRWAAQDRISIQLIDVPAFDADALASALDAVREEQMDGVAFVAIDHALVREALERLTESGLAAVTLVSDLTNSARAHYAGIDNLAAGRTAATLLGRFLGRGDSPILPVAGSLQVQDHRERLEGFQSVLQEQFPERVLLPVVEGGDDPVRVEALVAQAAADQPDLAGIYSFGAGNRGLIRALAAFPQGRRPVTIAHELTSVTRAALLAGHIDAVLNQDAGHEVRSAIRVLKAKADGAGVVIAQERIRIDIFLKENLP
ncbi:LacI family DNA-binding transcriptional regulator [Rhizobium sp. FKY42]|uniref:LacI family DNA-binding transcriptional regulator n=1 Tax=Rhizobium sp. FKY42 TaxID=2562310 RepID=UPI0010C01B23|nr:LacI family DNA-binding transcriptional regulator [Rhizobium sp. FKY42]